MAGNFQNQRFQLGNMHDMAQRNHGGIMGMNTMNQQMGFMEPGFNDQPLEFSGSIRNEPRVIDGDNNLSRREDDGSTDMPGDMHMNLQGNQWGMDPAMANYNLGQDFMSIDMMGTVMGQYQMDGGMPGERQGSQRVLSGSGFTLASPHPGRQSGRPTREKPIGCCTIFVGGIPALCTNEMLHEIFENFGTIRKLLRVGTRFYCHIRFMDEESVNKAFEVSGYRIRVEDNNDSEHCSVLRVDYSESRDDEADYMRKQEDEDRRRRELARLARREEEKLRQTERYSEMEAQKLTDKLKSEDTFPNAVSVLIGWLDRGDCKKQTSNNFFSLIQAAFSQTRRLSTEKQRLDDQIKAMAEMARKQTGDIFSQLSLISQVFARATKQPSRDQFSKAQRKHIEGWKKTIQDLCIPMQEELGMTDKGEADMDVSDEEDAVSIIKVVRGVKAETADRGDAKRIKLDLSPAPPPPTPPQPPQEPAGPSVTHDSISKDEADALRCQLEAFRNEVDLLKGEKLQYADEKETQIKALQHALLGMQQQLMEAKNKLKKEDETKKAEKSDSESDTKEASSSKSDITSTETTVLIENDAMLVGIISTFLHVHPFGASVEYLWSYLQRLNFNVAPLQIEALLSKFPKMFKQELFGVGASLEKRWQFTGFGTCMGQSPSNRTSTT